MNQPTLVLKKKRERSVHLRHPWIFSGAVAEMKNAGDGDIVRVVDREGNWLGYGFISATSQISCRMFEWDHKDIDPGSSGYWLGKIERARAVRAIFTGDDTTEAFRLIHAEGDFFPGLIADVYGQVLVLQILIKGVDRLRDLLVESFQRAGFQHIYLKGKAGAAVLEDIQSGSGWLSGGMPSPVTVRESGLRFRIDFMEGQKTGFFLDQRQNRRLLRDLSGGKRVLNMFSYTGGFSVYALAGGATEVVSVDTSEDALAGADENAALNFPEGCHRSIKADCFAHLKDLTENYYDIIVLDPPAFAKNARSVPNACRGYKQINLHAIRRIAPGGLLFTFSCSQNISRDLFRKIVFGAAADAGRNVRIVRQLDQPADHPVSIYHPEGEYIKGLLLWVE